LGEERERVKKREAREEFTQRALRLERRGHRVETGREEHSHEWLCHKTEGPSELGPYKPG